VTPEQRVIQAARAFLLNDHPDNYARLLRAVRRLDDPDTDPEPPQWVSATWSDVGKGDRIRYQGHETVVGSVHHSPLEAEVRIRGRRFSYDPAEPVEIQMDAKRRAEHEL
jgi:hypothetical protein